MKMGVFRIRSRRVRLVWLALLMLLFQQVTLSTYACPIAETRLPTESMMLGCDGMEMPDPAATALCDQHCFSDYVAGPDLRGPQAPPLAMTPLHFALAATLLPSVEARSYQDVPTSRSDPPPAQRFCSLQI
jgi:hypothetical protein